ncbi:MAG: exonuclease SbcCD subunit D [Anaerolineae bacterium]|nr:exonuclease SbcCD subunit D [Anaerolineae bacterium]
MRFIHAADFHLGYQQYGSKDRFNDFSRAFLHVVEQAVDRQVDFVLLAGDLFEKRTVEPLAMRVAVDGLDALRGAGIPVVAIEGNHERPYYGDQYSWVDFLDGLGYFRLLTPRFEEGRAILEPHGDAGGAYVDLPSGVRIYGIKYYGAAIGRVVRLFAEALAEMDHGGVDFVILAVHAGLEGQMPRYSGTLALNDLAPLKEFVDYLAMGHIHKPYAVDGWIYNPGSPETCSMEEVAWPERGYYLVDARPGQEPTHRAELIVPPRRPFYSLPLEVDTLTRPEVLYAAVQELIRGRGDEVDPHSRPVVELVLKGVLSFNRADLDLDHVQDLLDKAWTPLIKPRVRNQTRPAEFEMVVEAKTGRRDLERAVLRELVGQDQRYRLAADAWTRVALEVKRLSLEGAAPEAVIDLLRQSQADLLPEEKEAG